MSGFHDILLSPKFSYGIVGGSSFNTTIQRSTAGIEQRNINWEQSAGEWEIGFNLRENSEIEELIKFFMAQNGRGYSFRFLDWNDFQVVDELVGTATGGTGETFQITKTYVDEGSYSYTRDILLPVNVSDTDHTLGLSFPVYTTMAVKFGGVLKAETTDYTVDYSTGIITTVTAQTGLVTVSCSFHNKARFDSDIQSIMTNYYQQHDWTGMKVVGLKE